LFAPEFGWGGTAEDFNNDGWTDIVFAGNFPIFFTALLDNPGYILTNTGGSFFTRPLPGRPLIDRYSSGVASGDLNHDGYVDVIVGNGAYALASEPLRTDMPLLLINEGGQNSWLTVELQGTESNRDGIGAIVEVTADGREMTKEVSGGGGFVSHNSTRLTFGLGSANTATQVVVSWPSGRTETFGPFDANQMVQLTEGQGQ